MKNGKAPTREQKKIMKAHGLVPENWLVVKNLPDSLEVVSRRLEENQRQGLYQRACNWLER